MGLQILNENSTNPEKFFNETYSLITTTINDSPINKDQNNELIKFLNQSKQAADDLLKDKNKTKAKKVTEDVFINIINFVTHNIDLGLGGRVIKMGFITPTINGFKDNILKFIDDIDFNKVELNQQVKTVLQQNSVDLTQLPRPVLLSNLLPLPIPQSFSPTAEPVHVPVLAPDAEPAPDTTQPAPLLPHELSQFKGVAGGAIFSSAKNITEDEYEKIKKLLLDLNKVKKQVYDNIILKQISSKKTQPNINTLDITKIEPPKTSNFKISREITFVNGVIDKLNNDRPISRKDLHKFETIEEKIKNLDESIAPQKDKTEALNYIYKIKDRLKKQKKEFKPENIVDTVKIILDFKKVADTIKLILIGLTVISIIFYVVVVLISIYNLFNLLIKIIVSIIYLFYNTSITNNDTLSYTTKRIITCTKDNYTNDIFNILNEQLTALSIFNTNIYIIYILLGYVIIYLLYFIYSSMFSKYYILQGNIKDIDPNFTLLTIIAIIFICSFIHLLIYKFFFKTICLNKYKIIDLYEKNIDSLIKREIAKNKQELDLIDNFYKLLTDTTKRNEIDTYFSNMVLDLQDGQPTNLGEFLLIYDIYIYFEEYIYINDEKKKDIKDYFDEMIKGNHPKNTFISFLDTNERRLIKAYHEELPFYNQIPSEKLEIFKSVNTNIGNIIININKSIIKYTGTFYPFLFTCIYIIIICIYNFFCLYLIFNYISGNKQDELFPQIIYTMADKFIEVSTIIYNLINK